MATIVTRAGKGSPLTNAEVDANFTNLNAELATKQNSLVSGTSIKTVNGQSVLGSGNIQIDGGVTSFNTRTGAVSLSSGDVTTALGFTPYNATNPSGYITSAGTAANVSGTVAVANGGTGATTAAAARTSLGATTLGGNLFTLANVAAIAFPRINADNTVSALDAATFRTAIGAGTSSTTGTVTSVGGTGTVSGLTLSGTVTGSGNLTLGGTLSLTSGNVTTALGFTPYNATNPSGYIDTNGTARTIVENNGTVVGTRRALNFIPGTGISLSIADDAANEEVDITITSTVTGGVTSFNTRTGAVTLSSGDVTTALGFTPYNATNPSGYITSAGTAANVSGTVAVANGGTGATTAAAARTNLGATTLGSNLFTLANVAAIAFPRINADNSVSALDAASFRTAIGAGTSSTTGTVTSVGGTGTVSGLTLSGTVTGSGSLTLGGTLSVAASNFASQTANTVLAAPNGAAGVPTFRALVAADVPTLNQNTTGTAANVTGTVAVANGGTGATSAAAARTNLGATTLGGNLFTLANVAAIAFPRINADNTVSTLDAAAFRTAIGAGTSSTTGTVTSVGGTGTVSGLSLSGTVTASGNLTLGGTLSVLPSNFASQTANTVLAAPNGAAGVPTFRALVAADIPTLNQNTTGTAANVTGTVAIANGGTGATTAAAALTALGAYAASNPSGYITSSSLSSYVPLAGNVVMTGALVTANNVAFASRDTTGTNRNMIFIGADNFMNIVNGGNVSTRILNQAQSATLVTLSDASGNFTATGNVTAYSDERLKTDWADLPADFIERLAAVKSGTYTRIDTRERQAGASAQDMKNLLTEAVMTASDEQGTLSLAYGNAALVSVIELSKRVLRLEAQLAKLMQT